MYQVKGIGECISHLVSDYSQYSFLSSLINRTRDYISICKLLSMFDKDLAKATADELVTSLSQAVHSCIDQKMKESITQLYMEWIDYVHEKCRFILLFVTHSPFDRIRQDCFPN